jgi:hypothetical protein
MCVPTQILPLSQAQNRPVKKIAILVLASLLCAPVFADCVAPATPADPPDGSTASRDQMLAAMQTVKAYDAAIQDYLECTSKTGGRVLAEDNAVRSLRTYADKFNKEFRKFKAKNGD